LVPRFDNNNDDDDNKLQKVMANWICAVSSVKTWLVVTVKSFWVAILICAVSSVKTWQQVSKSIDCFTFTTTSHHDGVWWVGIGGWCSVVNCL
jgi:hypothetical protein